MQSELLQIGRCRPLQALAVLQDGAWIHPTFIKILFWYFISPGLKKRTVLIEDSYIADDI
jgi:hypothetical protein